MVGIGVVIRGFVIIAIESMTELTYLFIQVRL